MAIATDIASAVVTALNGAPHGTFGQSFTAVRLYVPLFDLKDMKTLHVSVVPKAMDMESATRAAIQCDYQVDVGVQKKISGDSDIDGLMSLVEQIADFLRTTRLSGVSASWVKVENSPIFAPDHLEQMRQFTSVLTVTYRVLR